MTDSATHSRALIIAGMHRSGTSLTANWLAQCGLDVGDKLVPADWSNPAGHYEDVTFSHLQRDILRANGTNHLVTDDRCFTVSAEHRAQALDLLRSRADSPQWGWKDPRTTLLLDFWLDVLPDARVLAVYRDPVKVIDSLLRREYGHHRKRRFFQRWLARVRYSFANLPLIRQYAQVWTRYNRDVLAFAQAHPERTVVLHVDTLVTHGPAFVDYLNRTWGFALDSIDPHTVYKPTLLTADGMPVAAAVTRTLVPACVGVLRDLVAQEQQSLARITGEAG